MALAQTRVFQPIAAKSSAAAPRRTVLVVRAQKQAAAK